MLRMFKSSPSTAGAVAIGLTILVVQVPAGGQAPAAGAQGAPAAQAPAGGRGGVGRGGRGAPSIPLSELRKIPAETTAAKVKDPSWKAPRNAWGHPDLEGVWTTDDMRNIPTQRPKDQMDRESLTPEEFARRAGGDEAGRNRAVNQETILRNEFGIRTFGYTSVVVDPPNGQMPAVTPAATARRKAQTGIGTFGTVALNSFEFHEPHEPPGTAQRHTEGDRTDHANRGMEVYGAPDRSLIVRDVNSSR